MSDTGMKIGLQFSANAWPGQEAYELFRVESDNRSLVFRIGDSWTTDVKELSEEIAAEAQAISQSTSGGVYALLEEPDALISLFLNSGTTSVRVAASSLALRDEVMERWRERIPKSPVEDGRVIFRFWTHSHNNGPQMMSRKLDVPTWSEIRPNYVPAVQGEIDWLMDAEDGEHLRGGRLILWQGPPGTGKTYTIRALANAWQSWADFHYVADADEFFSSHGANYMTHVLLHEESNKERWKVLVLEDAGELLATDARALMGQGLSRLLNIVDGVLGQGLKLLVLVTTNEELKTLHEAVTRNGRCASQLSFERFGAGDARAWLAERGLTNVSVINGDRTVSELYALVRGDELQEQKTRSVGFAS